MSATAIQPVRVDEKRNRFIYYSIITWDNNPAGMVQMYLRRLRIFGGLADSYSPVAIDLVDDDDSIGETVMLTRKGFEYLRRKLHFLREEVE